MPVSVNIPFSTTIIIPFNISSNKEEVISENNLKDNVFYEELRQYLFRISTNKHSIIDKLKYHTYISNYLGSNENKDNDLSFLETFFIDPEKVNKIIKDKIPFNFFFNRINLKLGKSNLHFGLNEPLIILNKTIKIGYSKTDHCQLLLSVPFRVKLRKKSFHITVSFLCNLFTRFRIHFILQEQ